MSRLTINSNIPSLNAQRSLSNATKQLGDSYTRLSSGLRINKASDDAAGLSISESLKTDSRLSNQAIRNVNDGISVISIISDTLDSQKNIVMRMAEISQQSANGVYSLNQREALQKEYETLLKEFDRIASTAKFNGISLLRNQTSQTLNIMAGITGSSESLLEVTAANSHIYSGMVTQKSDINESGLIQNSDLTFFRNIVLDPRNNQSSTLNYVTTAELQDSASIRFTDSNGNLGNLTFAISRISGDIATTSKYNNGSASLPNVATSQRVQYRAVLDNGETIIGFQDLVTTPQPNNLALNFATSGTSATFNFDFSSITFESYDRPSSSYTPSAIGFTNVLNQYSARRATVVLENKINEISSTQGQYGALESRLNFSQNLLSVNSENFTSANSRITDIDVAEESSRLAATQILQQSAASILAQANQQPQLVLNLLRDL